MAKLSADKKSVTVERGDTLTQIAVDYAGGYSKYKTLAAINNISNPDLIYIGQVIKLTNESGSSYTQGYTYGNSVAIYQFGALSTNDSKLFITWRWQKSQTDYFRVFWTYTTDGSIWLIGSDTKVSYDGDLLYSTQIDTYDIPTGARQVKVKIKPIAKSDDDNESVPWTADWSITKNWTVATPLESPDKPDVVIDKFKLTASLENIEIDGASHIEFRVIKDNSTTAYSTKKVGIVNGQASSVFNVDAGGQYKVHCRAYSSRDGVYSAWSQYSDTKNTIPTIPESITNIKALSSTSVYLSWSGVTNSSGYTVEYTNKKIYFDSSNEVQSLSVGEGITHAEITGLSSGEEYFFRVKATNSVGDSGWSEIRSVVIGKTPAAPTTWSSTTTAIVGNPVTLYWVHNAEDGSTMTYAELQLYIGDELEEYTLKYTPSENEEENENKTNEWVLDTSSYAEGTSVKWRVRTAGITKNYGEWSVQRTVEIYAPATLQLSMTDVNGNSIETLTTYPFYIKGLAGPKSQVPIGYHLAIKSNEIYETIDNIGNPKIVNSGEEMYSKYFDISDPLTLELGPSSVNLENGRHYTVTCSVSMNTGLTAEETLEFVVSWADEHYTPNAEIGVDKETMTATIRPYCELGKTTYYQVNLDSDTYTKTSTELESVWGELVENAVTTTGERVYSGVTADDAEIYYCIVDEYTPVEDVLLSVYRREFDGSFTELVTGLDSTKATTITDPHPALDYARYRIVATTKSTGTIGYYDPPGHPMDCNSVVIQWDEVWSSFETSSDETPEQPSWAGSMLTIPYNIDVAESNSSDISLVEYIGRPHPVSYYGTQLGVAATWNMEIPKEDKETLYGLRRLSRWMGDVYVREPSGSGYWASITVSFSQKHCELTIPITLSVSQVEGGM